MIPFSAFYLLQASFSPSHSYSSSREALISSMPFSLRLSFFLFGVSLHFFSLFASVQPPREANRPDDNATLHNSFFSLPAHPDCWLLAECSAAVGKKNVGQIDGGRSAQLHWRVLQRRWSCKEPLSAVSHLSWSTIVFIIRPSTVRGADGKIMIIRSMLCSSQIYSQKNSVVKKTRHSEYLQVSYSFFFRVLCHRVFKLFLSRAQLSQKIKTPKSMTFKRRFIFPLLTGSHFSLARTSLACTTARIFHIIVWSHQTKPRVYLAAFADRPSDDDVVALLLCVQLRATSRNFIHWRRRCRAESQVTAWWASVWNLKQVAAQHAEEVAHRRAADQLRCESADACLVISSLLCSSEWSGHEKSTSISLFLADSVRSDGVFSMEMSSKA